MNLKSFLRIFELQKSMKIRRLGNSQNCRRFVRPGHVRAKFVGDMSSTNLDKFCTDMPWTDKPQTHLSRRPKDLTAIRNLTVEKTFFPYNLISTNELPTIKTTKTNDKKCERFLCIQSSSHNHEMILD